MNILAELKRFVSLIRFQNLSQEKRCIVFYSEGPEYWPYFHKLLLETLKRTHFGVVYVSSSNDDPGLLLKEKKLTTIEIGEGEIRNWFFRNLSANIVVMTMPDLEKYQIRKSDKVRNYIYVQHSLVSLHMVYREGAFNHYDTIFCAGPHHVNEMKGIINHFNLPAKNLVAHGYARLDAIISGNEKHLTKCKYKPKTVLVAPSWGENSIIDTVGVKLIETLLANEYFVILRPHPQTFKFSAKKINNINRKFSTNPLFRLEESTASLASLYKADVMITDWSGSAFDFALGCKKPIVFIDLPRKINNPNYNKLEIEPVEVSIRKEVGVVLDPTRLDKLPAIIETDFKKHTIKDYCFNIGRSDIVGAKEIINIMSKQLES